MIGLQVQFLDDSQGGATDWSWSFPGGVPATGSGREVWVYYPTPGTYEVQLTITNPNGQNTVVREGAVTITEPLSPFTEDFAAGIDPLRWQVTNPEGDAYTWETFDDTSCNGPTLRINNRNSTSEFYRDYLTTTIDLRDYGQASLSFDVAHAPRNNSRWDELRINITDEQGKITNVFNQGGQVLATRSNTFSTFVPAGCDQWRTETVNLDEFAGQHIIVEFENISDEGNTIYLDNLSWAVNNAPLVQLTEPLDGSILELPPNPQEILIPVAAEASDPEGELATVVFYANELPFDTLTAAPFETVYEADSPGQYCFAAQATDLQGATAWSTVSCMTAEVSVGTTSPASLPLDLRLSPNPAGDETQLVIHSQTALGPCQLQLIDAQGRILQERSIDINNGTQQFPVLLTELPAGQYWVRLRQGTRQVSRGVIKG